MKVNRFVLSVFSIGTFTLSYLPLTVSGLPSYHNRSTGLKSKTADVEVRDNKMGKFQEINRTPEGRFQQNGESSPKSGYAVSMAWEVN